MCRFSGETTRDNTHYKVKRGVNLACWGEPHIALHSKYHPLTVVLDSDYYSSGACYNYQYQIHSIEHSGGASGATQVMWACRAHASPGNFYV